MKLSTHVLDLAIGRPASQLSLRLEHSAATLFEGSTDANGRCPALETVPRPPAVYRLRFKVADYFRRRGCVLPDPPFLDEVIIEFGISDPTSDYHVPLLVSPFSYSTYRGS